MNTTTEDVRPFLDAIRAHLDRHNLPGPYSVRVSADDDRPVEVHLSPGRGQLAEALLAWATTLDHPHVELRRYTTAGDGVLVTVCGRMPSGFPIEVWGGIAYDPAVFPTLTTGETQHAPLSLLRQWAKGVAA
ncbi:hypothetical protein [Amycolatopsis aidingensis]|uniref:hypothetical protein n=1 Tax=Amycolatopsis aidingensis TaxID=2842453 RepID=UPI001C0CB2EC|nr:hypothetical protein [Amycolatopsis aidingensis]